MQCYSELLPPSAVTNAVALHFISPTEKSLVVAKTSLLQVFAIRQTKDEESSRLSLVGEYELSGTITALEKIRVQDRNTDSLLVACRNAKISLIDWNVTNHRISTTSIHYYENNQIPHQPCDAGASHAVSILTVDPNSRCVALKFDQRQLAILPFRQASENELDDDMEIDKTITNGEEKQTPYKKSFVLSLPSLDESLTDVVDLTFLHNYREPTFGILTSKGQASIAQWEENKEALTYHVLTLDLEQGASTILASVPDLPTDLWKIVALPLPVGGVLLLGTNGLIHVAQSGRTHAIAVNEFAALSVGLNTSDQRSLDLKLEDCVVQSLERGSKEVLLVMRDGQLVMLQFTMLGPDVKAMVLSIVPATAGGDILEGLPSCSALLKNELMFLGTDEADSVLVNCHKQGLSRKRSHAEMTGQDDGVAAVEDDDDDDEEDDLYTTTNKRTTESTRKASTTNDTYEFSIADTLPNAGPINSVTFGKSSSREDGKLEMAAVVGRNKGSKLAIMTKDVPLNNTRQLSLSDAKAAWSVRAHKPQKGQVDEGGPDNLLFVFNGSSTKIYDAPWQSEEFDLQEKSGTEFEHDGETIEIGTLGNGRWIVHCRQNEVRTYEPDLTMSQIIPMSDDDENELSIVYASFSDPYLLLIRSDSSLQILQYDASSQDVEPLEMDEPLLKRKWLGGSLYQGNFTGDEPAAFLLADDGTLQILSLPEMKVLHTIFNAAYLQPVLGSDTAARRVGFKEILTEIFIADVGPRELTKPYLLLRTSADDLVVYEPFKAGNSAEWIADLRFRKVPVRYLPRYDEYLDDDSAKRIQPLRRITMNQHSAIAIPGSPPCLMLSEASSRPKILRVGDTNNTIVLGLDQNNAASSFALLSKDGSVLQSTSDTDLKFDSGWAIKKLGIATAQDEVRHVTFHEQTGMYVVSTSRPAPFYFNEDDTRHPDQDDILSRPTVPQYSLHLYSSSTHRIINTYEFQPGDVVTCLQVMPMDTSEHTHEVKSVVVAGTGLLRGEDMPAKGALVVFDIAPVVPEPGDPETGVKLHAFSRAETKGAVTAIAPFVGNAVGVSQGQKLMVRGLKEDGTCLPIAFLDVLCQAVTLKTLWKTGLWLAGDSWKGLWFGGFTEDPYKLTFLGKSGTQMEVLCAEFMPFEGQLFILAIDADMILHMLQYDPEDPKTISGSRLLLRASFNIGHWPTSMTLVPSTFAPMDQQSNGHSEETLYHILITTQSGSITLLTPLDGTAHRRLTNLHGQLVSVLEQPAALNPREYRSAGETSLRGVVDGMLLQRIGELGSARRAELLGRCGSDAWTMRSDLEIINGGGLGWL